jgi:mannose-6-phosphate isomerase-like protein (cupin superfamily)
MEYRLVNTAEKLGKFSEHWSSKIISQMNGYHFKLVKFQGEFVWHDHQDTDEVCIVFEGEMVIHFRNRDVPVKKGELFVIPKGVEHKTSAKAEWLSLHVGLPSECLASGSNGSPINPAPGDPRVNDLFC